MATFSEANAKALISVLNNILAEVSKGGTGATGGPAERAADELEGLTAGTLEYNKVLKKVRELEAENAAAGSDERLRAIQQVRELGDTISRQTDEQQKLNNEYASGSTILKNYGGVLFETNGLLMDLYTKFIPKTQQEMDALMKTVAKSVTSFKAFGATLGGLVTSATLKITNEFMNMALAQDGAISRFQQATGLGREFEGTIVAVRNANRAAGVSYEESGAALTTLTQNFSKFTQLGGVTRAQLMSTTALLSEVGVAGTTTASALDTATRSLGMTAPEANAMLHRLKDTALSLGRPINQVVEDFVTAAPKLAFYGDRIMDVFEGLEKQAKVTGLSVDQILGLVGEKFDTFEGAGQAVGKLNAILGGPYLNSIDMLNASEEERLEMIKASVDAAGIQFDQLNKFEQKAFASAIGTDVDTLRRSMMNLSETEQLNIIQQEKLARRAAQSKNVMDELKNSIRALIVDNKDLFDDIIVGVKNFSEFLRTMSDTDKQLITSRVKMGGFAGIIFMIGRALFRVVKGFKAVSKVMGGSGIKGGMRVAATSLRVVSGTLFGIVGTLTAAYGAVEGFVASLQAGGSFSDILIGSLIGVAQAVAKVADTVSFGLFGKLIEKTSGMTIEQAFSSDRLQGAGVSAAASAVTRSNPVGNAVRNTAMPAVVGSPPLGGASSSSINDVNVVVKIGDKELKKLAVEALDGNYGRQTLTPRYQA